MKFEYFPKAHPVIRQKSVRRSHEMPWRPFCCPQETCLRPVWDLFETCLWPVCDLFETCLRPVWELFETCLRPVWDLFETCLWPVWELFETCLRPVCDLFETCLRPVCDLFETCLRPVWDLFETCLRPLPPNYDGDTNEYRETRAYKTVDTGSDQRTAARRWEFCMCFTSTFVIFQPLTLRQGCSRLGWSGCYLGWRGMSGEIS